MRSTSKLELAVDKNVFYVAAEIDNPPAQASYTAMETLLRILNECHRIVVDRGMRFLLDIVNKLKLYRNKVAALYVLKLVKEFMCRSDKVREVEIMSIGNVPRKDIDIASFAIQS